MRDLLEKISKGPIGSEGDEIKAGDCVTSIAFKKGMLWEKIWRHDRNKLLSATRRHPNMLLPGDKIFIPEKEVAQSEKKVDKEYTFWRKGLTCGLQLRFTAFGAPRADEDFQVFNGKAELGRGKLNSEGMLEIKIPVEGCIKITVLVGKKKEKFEFEVGKMPPATEPRGIQMRLSNLGYYCGEFSDVFTPETEDALRRFLWKNGELDENNPTPDEGKLKSGLACLVSVHGS